jgi:hypothetical protein
VLPQDVAIDSALDEPFCSWDITASGKNQLKSIGQLHALLGGGTATLVEPEDQSVGAEEAVELLHQAWEQTELVRIRFRRAAQPARQLPALWEV